MKTNMSLSRLVWVVVPAVVLPLSEGHGLSDVPAYCHFSGQHCEPGNEWQCEHPAVATPESCQQACDECTGGPCVATVLAEGRCQFRGCNSSCMVFEQTSCPGQGQEGSPRSAVHAPGRDLYARNVAGHFCRSYAYEQQAKAAAKVAIAAVAPPKDARADAQGYCHFSGQDCEAGNDWQCEQPKVATPESCQRSCSECSGGLCVATVVAEGKCQFRGCNSSCMVFEQTNPNTCPSQGKEGSPRSQVHAPGKELYARIVDGHFCRSYAYEQQAAAAAAVIGRSMVLRKPVMVDLALDEVSRRTLQCGLAVAGTGFMVIAAFAAFMSRRVQAAERVDPWLLDTTDTSDLEC